MSVTGILTGGLIDPTTPDYAGAAARNERGRQALINAGMQQINAIFGGGTVPTYQQATGAYNPGTQYYTFAPGSKGPSSVYKPWNPVSHSNSSGIGGLVGAASNPIDPGGGYIAGSLIGGLFGSNAPDYKGQYPRMLGNNRLFVKGPDQTFQGFDQNFYNQRENAYIHSAMPQLGGQFKTTSDSIDYGLANRGLVDSSAARTAKTRLAATEGEAEQNIRDSAVQQGQALKSQVEAARQNAISQLYATGDPSQAASSAISSAAGFQIPQTYGPISNMFSGLMNSYYNQAFFNNYNPTQYNNQLPMGYGLGMGMSGYGGSHGFSQAPVSY